jgi:diguanylate cyclase (GGDEF)-like protein
MSEADLSEPRQPEDPNAHVVGDYLPIHATHEEVLITEPPKAYRIVALARSTIAGVSRYLKVGKDQLDYCPVPEIAEDVLSMGLSKKRERIALAGVARRLKVDKERLQYEADHDELTGALKRKAFQRAIEEDQRANPGASRGLIFIDLGNQKATNTILGHAGGDQTLKGVVKGVVGLFQRTSDIIGRFGGDEFAAYIDTSIDVPDGLAGDVTAGPNTRKRTLSVEEAVAVQVTRVTAIREKIVTRYPKLNRGKIKFYVAAGGIVYDPNSSFEANLAAAEAFCDLSKAHQSKRFGKYREADLSPEP